jgi:hypothetical protein
VDAITELALESIPVEQGHEELEIFIIAIMGCGCEQKKKASEPRGKLTKAILMPAAKAKGYGDLSSIDPDNSSPGSYGDWLRLSMEEFARLDIGP